MASNSKVVVIRKCNPDGSPGVIDNVYTKQKALSAYIDYLRAFPTVDQVTLRDPLTGDDVTVKEVFNGKDWSILRVDYRPGDGDPVEFARYIVDVKPLNRTW